MSKRVDFSGINNPFYGKRHTPITKKKMSEARIGMDPSNKNKVLLKYNDFVLIKKAIEFGISGRKFEKIFKIDKKYFYQVKNGKINEGKLFYGIDSEVNFSNDILEKLEALKKEVMVEKTKKDKVIHEKRVKKQLNIEKRKKKICAIVYPSILEIWDYKRNSDSPWDFEVTSNKKVFIVCKEHGQIEQPRSVKNICNSLKNGKNGCIKCSHKLVGNINSIKKNRSREEYENELIKLGLGIKFAEDLEFFSYNKQFRHICHCGNEFMAKPANILKMTKKSCGCMTASYPEIYTASLLKALGIKFNYQKTYPDLRSDDNGYLKYDFVIDKYKVIIETDGNQHRKLSNFGKSKSKIEMIKDLEAIKRRDKIKDLYCKNVLEYKMIRIPQNLFENYIYSCEAKKIIMEIFENKYDESFKFKLLWDFNNNVQKILEMNADGKTTKEIAEYIGCNYYTVNTVLKRLGVKSNKKYAKGSRNKNSVPIIQLDLDGNFIAEYESMSIAAEKLGYTNGNIGACCLGKTQTAYGYIWMKKDKYIPDKKIEIKYKYNIRKILKLSKDEEVIGQYKSITEAANDVDGDIRNICACCRGRKNSAYGYKWRYAKI
ncbi:TPA: hypothetical protein I9008_002444 [Clostridium perfringens]|nr:hypothetical protein [Clostridium perfringens]